MRMAWLTSWLKRKPVQASAPAPLQGDLTEAELAELADLITKGDPDSPNTAERIAELLRQSQ